MAVARQKRTAVITGASAGVGRATAMALACRGWRVALMARSAHALDETSHEVIEAGGEAMALTVDVADFAAVKTAADRVIAVWGCIDLWINNAMVSVFAPVTQMTAEEFRRVTEVTYLGYVHGTLAALTHMKPRNAGTIIQVGSALSYRAIPLQSAYCAAKFAVRGFTDALRSELIHDKSAVRLVMVQLPAVNTPQFDWARNKMGKKARPLGTVYQPKAVAEQIVAAAEQAPRELWVGFSTLQTIAGSILAPRFLDWFLARKAYDGQLSSELSPQKPADNLLDSPSAGHAVRGRFDTIASATVHAFSQSHVMVIAIVAVISVVLVLAIAV